MTDEDDVDVPVTSDQKNMQQHEKPLGEILHRLGHRPRYVHQAEHHRLSIWAGHTLETVIADIQRVDIRNYLAAKLHALELVGQPLRLIVGTAGACIVERLAQRLDLPLLGPAQ